MAHAASAPKRQAAPPPGATTPAALTAQIDAHIGQPRFDSSSWGVAVISLDNGHTLYQHQANHLLQPASTTKLFTAGLSLASLGTSYRMPTRLLFNGSQRSGLLTGQLILYGMGDPTLGTGSSSDWAEQLASQLAAQGVRSIQGDLIADDGYFAGPAYGSGWEAGDLQSWFAVPSSALSVDENIVKIEISPGSAVGRPAKLEFTPGDAAPNLDGQITTSARGSRNDINLYRAPGTETLHIFGSYPHGDSPRDYKLAITDPALLAGKRLRQALSQKGIHVSGRLRVMHWPQDDSNLLARAVTLAEVQSPPVQEIVQRGLKRSQNLYLQNLLLSVGATQSLTGSGFRSTESRAIGAMHRWLVQIGIPPSSCQIGEGTGLSRRDLITPDAMVRLLSYLSTQPYAGTVYEALPIAGVDGTLYGRMRHTAAENNVHAKTGSMSFVHALAGYVTTATGEHLAFAIMLNNYERAPNAPSASTDLDAIAVLLANYRGVH